jgi:signal peptidase II
MNDNKQNLSLFKKFFPWLLTILAVAIDQITKIIVVNYNTAQSIAHGYNPTADATWLSENPLQLVGEWLQVNLLYNDAAIFGLDFGIPDDYRQIILIISTLIAIGVIVIFYNRIKPQKLFPRAMLALVIGGGVGNLIDRIFGHIIHRGEWKLLFEPGVVDWIDTGIPAGVFGLEKRLWWYIFNMADAFAICSMILLLLYIIFTKDSDLFKHKKKSAPPEEAPEAYQESQPQETQDS